MGHSNLRPAIRQERLNFSSEFRLSITRLPGRVFSHYAADWDLSPVPPLISLIDSISADRTSMGSAPLTAKLRRAGIISGRLLRVSSLITDNRTEILGCFSMV